MCGGVFYEIFSLLVGMDGGLCFGFYGYMFIFFLNDDVIKNGFESWLGKMILSCDKLRCFGKENYFNNEGCFAE